MKKLLLTFAAILSIFAVSNVSATTLPKVTSHEKVTIYIFRGKGCPHCQEAIKYLYNNISKYSDYMTVKTYEVWKNSDNASLMQAVAKAKGEDANGVPYIVIGNSYSTAGYGNDDSGKKIISEALKAYQDDSYVDLVAKTIKDTNASVSATSLNEAASEENITSDSTDTNSSKTTTDSKENTDTKSNKYDVYIILGIFIVVIGGIAVLALTSNKQK
jgi:glutaredoxin